MLPPKGHPVLLFDGICNYCNAWVDFILRHDKKKKIYFATLQSDAGKKLLKEHHVPSDADSAILIDDTGSGIKVFTKSAVGLRIMKHLGGIHYPLYLLIAIPAFIRDPFYNIIARNRYKWWGKRESCRIPTEEEKGRFLS